MKAILWLPIVRYNGMDLDYPYGTVFVENRRYRRKMNLGNRMQFLTKPWKSTRTWDSTGILGPTLTGRSPPPHPPPNLGLKEEWGFMSEQGRSHHSLHTALYCECLQLVPIKPN